LSKNERIQDAKGCLMGYTVEWLAKWSECGASTLLAHLPAGPTQTLEPYRALLAGPWPDTKVRAPLLSIFSRVRDPDREASVPQRYWQPAALSLQPTAPVKALEAQVANLTAWWQGFAKETETVLEFAEKEGERNLECFSHLLHKWAWAIPCSYGEPGVSAYDEFRALGALLYASDQKLEPASTFLLVGGDFPGIQEFIYTITSKGAAKGLRGRSFFIQLLGDAVIRKLCHRLGLIPEVSVIYAAGGNFMLLAPLEAAHEIRQLRWEINDKLLKTFEGDLYLCLDSQELARDQVKGAAFARDVSKRLKQAIAHQKRQRFREEARDDWSRLFAPKGKGGDRYCAVCQRELEEGEGIPIQEDFSPPQGPALKCDHCVQFEALAGDIGYDNLLLTVSLPATAPAPDVESGWQDTVYNLTGIWYDFCQPGQTIPHAKSVYAINDPKGFLDAGAHGFLFLGNTTPRRGPTIKTFEDMADVAAGIKRVGVLRMDVDDLGRMLVEGLEQRTMALTSALSIALERFFGGSINAICSEVEQSRDLLPQGFKRSAVDLLYIIYSGGDDLFVVGTWDRLPILAERIRNEFAIYAGFNPYLHISAGLTLEDRKFPLYRAAEQAYEALEDGAKAYRRPDAETKDAITFLGQTVGWEEFAPGNGKSFGVKPGARRLVELMDRGAPRSLLQVMQSIHSQYLADLDRNLKRKKTDEGGPSRSLYFGRWMWLRAYQLRRMADQHKKLEDNILQLQSDLLHRKWVRLSGLAARWAEYLTRKE